MARVPGGFGVNDVMGVRRPSRAVDLSADQRRVVEQMALQEREQAMFEQAGLGRADEPYSDPLMGAWNKVVEARIPTENLPGSPTSLGLGVPLTGGPKGLAEWLNTLKYMVEPIMPRDFGASGEHANTPLVGVPKVIGTGVGLGIMGARAARKPLGKVLSRLFGGGDEAADVASGVMKTGDEVGPMVTRADVPHPYGRTPAWVDEAGTEGPVIFHGTSRLDPIEGFEVGSAQRGWGSEGGIRSNAGLQGVYGTTSPEIAQIYVGSGSAVGGSGGRIYNLTLDGTPRVLDLTAGKPMPSDIRELLRARMMEGPNMHLRTPEMRAMLADETTSMQDLLQNRQALLNSVVDTPEANALREAVTELYDVAKTTPHAAAGEHSILRRYTNEENIEWIFLKPEDVRVARSTIDPPRSPDWMYQPETLRALEAREAARARATGAPYEPGRYDPSVKPDPGPYKGVV